MTELQVLGADSRQWWRALRLESIRVEPDAFDSNLAEWQGPDDCEQQWRVSLEQTGSWHRKRCYLQTTEVRKGLVAVVAGGGVGSSRGDRPGVELVAVPVVRRLDEETRVVFGQFGAYGSVT